MNETLNFQFEEGYFSKEELIELNNEFENRDTQTKDRFRRK